MPPTMVCVYRYRSDPHNHHRIVAEDVHHPDRDFSPSALAASNNIPPHIQATSGVPSHRSSQQCRNRASRSSRTSFVSKQKPCPPGRNQGLKVGKMAGMKAIP
jgi:hypothetical protein